MTSIARTDFFTERPAVGTRVILPAKDPEDETDRIWCVHEVARHGVIVDLDTKQEYVRAKFDDGGIPYFETDYGRWDVLLPEQPISVTPAPSEITIGGVRYTLTPVQEAEVAPEPKREPKQGEVWHDENGIWLLVTDERDGEDDPRVTDLDGDNAGKTGFQWRGEMTYGFPNLRAAIAAGVLS